MRILYVLHARFPTEKAYGSQVAAVCDALCELGHDVTLVTPSIHNLITEKAHSYYAMSKRVTVQALPHRDYSDASFIPESLRFLLTMFSYRRALAHFLKNETADIVYVRSPLLLRTTVASHIPVVLELHTPPRRFLSSFTRLCNRCALVVCLTQGMRAALERMGVASERLIVEGDGVTLHRYQKLASASEEKARWNLPTDRTIVGYIGSLVTMESVEKGVRELIESVPLLLKTQKNLLVWIVGGPVSWQETYVELAQSLGASHAIRFDARIAGEKVPSAIAACDVCVYPAPKSDHVFFQRDTSPLKLFEYLAAGRPIVCADIPPVRDIVDERSVLFCRPGDASSLAGSIEYVLSHPEDAAERIEHGKKIVEQHDWTKRMQRVMSALVR